ncbi:uncharacterized protein LOC132204731 [Neocloeon triangulifer]|uniref:uncharacterized protein LOC132204731 n=1 Tax=Neocloeon triangulifer TaxID=2078957 RepID=UPI00286F1D17|nr:uncharacterized protein LOC132204731 [Neocloeon triangulifer]
MRHKRSHDFFQEWLLRSESRKSKWLPAEDTNADTADSQLDHKIQHLRSQITDLIDQDTSLFEQFFALQDSIDELKAQMQQSDDSDGCFSSLASSTCSLVQADDPAEHDDVFEQSNQKGPTSMLMRQRVSYPPISRNRCRRSQTMTAVTENRDADEDDEGVDVLDRVVLRRLHSLHTQHYSTSGLTTVTDGGESSVSSLDSGISIPAKRNNNNRNNAKEREIFV